MEEENENSQKKKLIVDGNAVYELDIECIKCKDEKDKKAKREKKGRKESQ